MSVGIDQRQTVGIDVIGCGVGDGAHVKEGDSSGRGNRGDGGGFHIDRGARAGAEELLFGFGGAEELGGGVNAAGAGAGRDIQRGQGAIDEDVADLERRVQGAGKSGEDNHLGAMGGEEVEGSLEMGGAQTDAEGDDAVVFPQLRMFRMPMEVECGSEGARFGFESGQNEDARGLHREHMVCSGAGACTCSGNQAG